MVKLVGWAVALVTAWGVWFVWPKSEPPSRLVIACTKGWDKAVDRLLVEGADPNRATPQFEEYERSPYDKSPVRHDSPLTAAVNEAAVDTRATSYAGDRRLGLPQDSRRYKVVVSLLDHGADPSLAVDGTPPIFAACRYASPLVVQLLIQRGASVCARDKKGFTPLHAVSEYFSYTEVKSYDDKAFLRGLDTGTTRCVHLLVRAGADIEARDLYGRTPLHIAALHGNIPMAEALIANGADLKATDMGGLTPKDCAKSVEMLEFLDKAGG